MSNLNELAKTIFDKNCEVGWWSQHDILKLQENTGNKYNKETATLIASKLALIHSEVSEALEGMRKGLKDDHLPHRTMFEVELADTMIRILDLCGFCDLDIHGALAEKMAYNQTRLDHKMHNRQLEGGKTI